MQSALSKVDAIKNLELSPAKDGGTATFQCAKDFDYKAKLNAIAAAGNEHVAGWSEAK